MFKVLLSVRNLIKGNNYT